MAKLDIINNDSSKYKIEAIYNNGIYAKKLKISYLLEIYYQISWKNYLKEKNIYKPYSAIQHHWKLNSLFYKNNSNKPTMIFEAIDTALLIAKPIIKPVAKPTIKLTTTK